MRPDSKRLRNFTKYTLQKDTSEGRYSYGQSYCGGWGFVKNITEQEALDLAVKGVPAGHRIYIRSAIYPRKEQVKAL